MRSIIINLTMCMLLWTTCAMADDSIPDQLTIKSPCTPEKRGFWASLVPSQLVVQNAGNMGLLSAGIGWDYGRRRQWETNLMVGFVPKYKAKTAKPTATIKENYIPWRCQINEKTILEPLSCGAYLNTIIGGQFWSKQPKRYPNNYYWFSTRIRINVFFGERLTWNLPRNKRHCPKSITAFYECSTCDLYMFDFLKNHSVKMRDIVGFSLGMKLQLF